jgi:hypothetical protein
MGAGRRGRRPGRLPLRQPGQQQRLRLRRGREPDQRPVRRHPGQPWVQDYTAAGSGEQVNVTHDQQGDILGEVNSNGTTSPQGDDMYVTDNLGSGVASIDSSGHGVLTDPYTAYGLDAQPGSLDPMFTFTGALQDTVSPGTGFVHLGDRWYDPASEPEAGVGNQAGPARFTQPDSSTQLDSPADGNLYAYAADNPTTNTDPTGRCDIFSGAGIGSVIGTAVGGIGGALVGGLVTGGIGAVPGFFLGAGEGATLGTLIGGAVCGLESLF